MSTPLQAPRVRLTIEPRLQDMVGIKFPQSKVVAGRLEYRLQRRQANELGRLYGGAEVGCGPANGFQGHRDGGLIEIGQVHPDLSHAADIEAECPPGRTAASTFPDLSGPRSRYLDVVCIQVSVESDQDRTGAHGDGSSVGIEYFRTIIRLPQGVLEPGGDPLVTTPSDVGEGPAVPGRRGSTVEEDGESQGTQALDLACQSGVHPRMGVLDVLPFVPLEGATMDDAVQGHEREDVEHAHPGVYAGLAGEVEFGGAGLRQGDGALEHRVYAAGERE